MTIHGLRIRIRLLSPIIFLLMIAFSGMSSVLPPLLSLSIHELSHILCAILLSAKIDEIELMPFGAAMRLYELWQISPAKLMLISLAGPLSNILFSSLLAVFLFFFPSYSPSVAPFLYASLMIAFVNLLPALPLDGGRFMTALLSLKMKRAYAVRIGIWAGRILGVILILSSAYVFLETRAVPLMPILASVYLFASGEQEKRYCEGATMRMLLLNNQSPKPVQRAGVIMVNKCAKLLDAVNAVRPGEDSLFAITDDEGELVTLLPLKKVLFEIHENSAGTMDALTKKNPNKISNPLP